MFLNQKRYEEIKNEVVNLYEECELCSFPINCFEIAAKMNYELIPYSELSGPKLIAAMKISSDGFHLLVERKSDGMFRWIIFYNNYNSYERQRWTIMHEIGHIVLDHTQDSELAEAEANFFAKYSIAPPPLIHQAGCEDYIDIADKFELSLQAAYYAMAYYQKWLHYGPLEYEPIEERILELFGFAA